jgi:hypothetical protein
MGKGSKRRPQQVSNKQVETNWARVFKRVYLRDLNGKDLPKYQSEKDSDDDDSQAD